MRNTLILTEQIKENRAAGLDDYHAVIEATVQRTRPVILTALAGLHSSDAFRVLGIDGLYADWRHGSWQGPDPAVPSCALCGLVRIKPAPDELYERSAKDAELRTAIAAE
ncbi:hypothetical protein ACVIQY_000831 [Bradyrhizobium sp. USDA 3051]